MSREEAIKVLKEYLELDKDIDSEYLEAQKVAIEALEEQENPNSIRINFVGEKEAKEFDKYLKNQQPKESVLDKIRDEIDKARFTDKDTRVCKNALASGLEMAMQIIDKYKESEDKK